VTVELFQGDCIPIMAGWERQFDAIIADLPYGTTACKWDTVIPFAPLWEQYKRLIKPEGAVVLFGSQPFTSALVMSNVEWFKYEWVWEKSKPTGFLMAKHRPMKAHENILVFSEYPATTTANGAMVYRPQGIIHSDKPFFRRRRSKFKATTSGGPFKSEYTAHTTGYPCSILPIHADDRSKLHPTQKPVALLEYLIRTYTNEGETVLDNTMGSGSTGVACVNTGRSFVGIELLPEYYEIAQQRIAAAQTEMHQLTLEEGNE